ncbi:outer membrane beta-barrel protein [Usitatibacter palustris]|uniref:Outer membrane protein beta-barrel domain-containing protein n=1 Tax=Usitatibacter palustris TaxID=2732487 RepID=A0A6M4H813_9PROT|nr:outer membrane beta-barrel protein [Usitatibacter palustris]QJR15741.1 hypothetical protein DSM104440_02567 [Usitatibacter palustris]
MNKKIALAAASLISCAAPFAHAADPWDRAFTFQIGAFRAEADTNIRLDADVGGGIGTSVSLEGDFGMQKTKTLPTFDFLWRINNRHGIDGSYVTLDRNGSRTLTGSINWGDATFPINTTVNSHFESDTLRVAYRYSPINDQGTELAFLLGLHYTKFKVSAGTAAGTVSDEASVDFPLPTIGILGSARFAETLRIMGYGQLLKVKIGDYDGELVNFAVGLEWAFHPQAYVGVGYNYYKYNLVSEKGGARGEFDYRFDGPTVYLGYSF